MLSTLAAAVPTAAATANTVMSNVGPGGYGHAGFGPGGYGPHVPFFGLFFVPLLIAAVIVLAVLLARRTAALRRTRWTHSSPLSQAQQTLAERFAQGDIEEDEYRKRLEVLRANAGVWPEPKRSPKQP